MFSGAFKGLEHRGVGSFRSSARVAVVNQMSVEDRFEYIHDCVVHDPLVEGD
jgi:hypothetical protein